MVESGGPVENRPLILLCNAAGFHYLRKAVEVQSDMIVDVFGDVAKAQGLDPSILDVKAHPRVINGDGAFKTNGGTQGVSMRKGVGR